MDYYRTDVYKKDIINKLIKKYNFKSYLEIGVFYGETFNAVECEIKTSVDPKQYGSTTHQMTSDEFFKQINKTEKFDVIFIDGLHTYEQCYKDIENATKHLSDNGFILCHDMNPIEEWWAGDSPLFEGAGWTGNVYKSFIKFRQTHLDYSCCLLFDCDLGIGIIRKGIGQQIQCNVDTLTFNEFSYNKNYLMNCISTDDFIKTFC